MNVPTKFETVALPVSEIIGGRQKNWAAPGYIHAPVSPKFLWAFIRNGPVNVLAKFEVHSLPVPEIIEKFGQPLDTSTLHFLKNF